MVQIPIHMFGGADLSREHDDHVHGHSRLNYMFLLPLEISH